MLCTIVSFELILSVNCCWYINGSQYKSYQLTAVGKSIHKAVLSEHIFKLYYWQVTKKEEVLFGTNVGHHDSKGSHWTAWHVQTGWLTFMKWTPLVEVLWIQHSHMTIGTFYWILRTFYLLIKIQSVHFSLCMCLGLDINYLLSENSNDTNKNYDTVMQTINSLIWNTCLHFQNTTSNFLKIV